MNRKYELWLDESGDFQFEALKKTEKRHASLVGGILIEEEQAKRADLGRFIGDSGGHSCEMDRQTKRRTVIPALQALHETYGAHLVYFENTRYEDGQSGRQLYLRMLAEGIVQLLLRLDSVDESVSLNVTIAQRQDVDAEPERQRIGEEEYIEAIQQLIARKKRERKIQLNSDTSCVFRIVPAYASPKLQLADFACNVRFTLRSNAFDGQREAAQALFEDAYVFSMYEMGTKNYIRVALNRDDIADAFLELCTTQDNLNETKIAGALVERMRTMSYYLVKSQLRQCAAEIDSYAIQITDYAMGIRVFRRAADRILPVLSDSGLPVTHLMLSVYLQLADMYLRAGNIIEARRVVERCREQGTRLEGTLENLLSVYRIEEKDALLCIDEFDYARAEAIMRRCTKTFENLLEFVLVDETLQSRFPHMKSEYYGDALCMQLYAMMFLLREQPERYTEMVRLSDIALGQYPNIPSELERHRQYRSHFEATAGKFESAVRWLMLAKGQTADELTAQALTAFLQHVHETESREAERYYLMYYLHIMTEAKLCGDPIGDLLYQALLRQREMLVDIGVFERKNRETQAIALDIDSVKDSSGRAQYHPTEVILWKLASFRAASADDTARAAEYYKAAMALCSHADYLTMNLTDLGIHAEYTAYVHDCKGPKVGKKEYRRLLETLETLEERMQTQGAQASTQSFAAGMAELIRGAQNEDGTLEPAILRKAARRIAY